MVVNYSGAVAQLIECRTIDYEIPDSNPVLPCQTLGQYFHTTLFQFSQCMGKYLAVGNGGHLYTNSLRALITIWLNASQRSPDGVRLISQS